MRSILLAFIFRSIKPKIQKYIAALYFICDLLFQSTTIFWHHYPKGIDNPFNTWGCEVLLFVCRCCLRCVAWLSYWFDNLGFFIEGNTYRRCAASSLPLWGNTDVVLADINAVRKMTAQSAIKFLKELVCRFGVPARIITDNGTQFTSRAFMQYVHALGCKISFASVARPRSNGQS